MSQEQLQRVQQLISEGRFDEARAILQHIDVPDGPELLEMLDRMEALARQAAAASDPAPSPAGEAAPVAEDDFSFTSIPDRPTLDDEAPGDFLDRIARDHSTTTPDHATVTPEPEPAPSLHDPIPAAEEPVRIEGETRIYSEGTYEMLWDCQYCGTKKLLGKTHRHCPNCGAAQNPDSRYFPAEDEYVAVEDHEFVGVDVTCSSCDTLNSGNAEFCGNCGAPLTDAARAKTLESETRRQGERFASSGSRDLAKERFDAEMERVGVKPKRSAKKPNRRMLFGLIGLVVLCIAAAAVIFFWTNEATVFVTGHSWERTIEIEEYGAVSESAWCDSMPGGAYNVSRQEEIRTYRQVPDGEDCQTVRVDNGDGTFSQERRCTTRYRDEPVYDTKCYYTIDRWTYSRSVQSEGRSLSDEPYWPDPNLNCPGQQQFGCERERGRSDDYTLHLQASEGDDSYTCDVEEAMWRSAAIDSRWTMEVGAVLGEARCGTLERAN